MVNSIGFMEIAVPISAAIGLIVAFALSAWIGKMDEGTGRMKEIAGHIREGAMAFLKREYKTMVIVIIVLFLLIGLAISWITAVLYVIGACLSVLAGFFGMNVATKGNVRTARCGTDQWNEQSSTDCIQKWCSYGTVRNRLGAFRSGYRVRCIGFDHSN